MQRENIDQDGATTYASKPHVRTMNEKRDDARRTAEQLIAEENRDSPHSAIQAYFIAAVIGLVIWGALYYLWQML